MNFVENIDNDIHFKDTCVVLRSRTTSPVMFLEKTLLSIMQGDGMKYGKAECRDDYILNFMRT